MQSSPTSPAPPSPATPETPIEGSVVEETDASTGTALEPVTAQPTAITSRPPLPSDGFGETVAFKPLDLRINRKAGAFVLDGDGGEVRDKVVLIPRGCHRAQMFFGLPYKPNEPHVPSCQSPDAKVGMGWIDVGNQVDAARKCVSCPRKGFGAGHCTDLMVMLAFDLEKDSPVLTRFQNAEINPRKGAFTLAVNRFRAMGLAPVETAMTISFQDVPGTDFKELVFDIAPVSLPQDTIDMMDVCWAAYEEARGYESQELLAQYEAAA